MHSPLHVRCVASRPVRSLQTAATTHGVGVAATAGRATMRAWWVPATFACAASRDFPVCRLGSIDSKRAPRRVCPGIWRGTDLDSQRRDADHREAAWAELPPRADRSRRKGRRARGGWVPAAKPTGGTCLSVRRPLGAAFLSHRERSTSGHPEDCNPRREGRFTGGAAISPYQYPHRSAVPQERPTAAVSFSSATRARQARSGATQAMPVHIGTEYRRYPGVGNRREWAPASAGFLRFRAAGISRRRTRASAAPARAR